MRQLLIFLLIPFLFLGLACSTEEAEPEQAPETEETPEPVDPPEQTQSGGTPPPDAAAKDPSDEPTPPDEPSEPAPPPAPAPKPKAVAKDAPPKPAAPKGPHPALKDPSLAEEKAPENFRVKFETTKGDFVVAVTRSWSPRGADRFYNLVKIGYFQDIAFFRVIDGFMAQFGIHGDPDVNLMWKNDNIQDDPVKQSNGRGYISFAKTNQPNSRSVQFFINFGDNARLDGYGFSPFGRVVEGMEVVDSLYKGYGEGAPQGQGPAQNLIQTQGNRYLKARFPKLDYIKNATVQ